MNYYTSPSYLQTKSIKMGEYHLPSFWKGIVDRIGADFRVWAMNIELDCSDERNRQDIGVILERNAEVVKLQHHHENEIAALVMPLLYSPDRPADDETKNQVLPWRAGRQADIYINWYSFEKIYLMDISRDLNSIAEKKLKRKYGKAIVRTTHNMGTQHIFYHKDADVVANRTNGMTDDILNIYFESLKSLDQFGYFSLSDLKMIFDSQETIDRDFGGNEAYYFR